jgi:hypothetical protein
MATTNKGPKYWEMDRDADGHRTYRITFRVRSDDRDDGPAVVLATAGLPRPGDPWDFLGDSDPQAVCTHEAEVRPVLREEPYVSFDVEFTFTSKPFNFCQGGTRDDPTSHPPEVSVTTRKVREEAALDAYGFPLLSSSFEQLRGPAVERERSVTTVTVKANLPNADFSLPAVARLRDHTNATPMWGMPIDCVLFADFSAEKKYAADCAVYWESAFVFEVDPDGWTKDAADEGLKVLRGKWEVAGGAPTGVYLVDADADPKDPRWFEQYKDPRGENTRVRLNGAGLPAGVVVARSGAFVSVQAGNTGRAVTDRDWWLPLRGGYSSVGLAGGVLLPGFPVAAVLTPEPFDPKRRYLAGTLALGADGGAYVAVQDEPPDPTGPAPGATGWLALPGGAVLSGRYSPLASYGLGAVTDGGREETAQGYVPVKLYPSVELLRFLPGQIPGDLNLAD